MNFNINELNDQEINKIIGALGNLPYKESAQLINKISQQVRSQMEAAQAAKQEEESEQEEK